MPSAWVPVRTGDGSFTLDNPGLNEHYHSLWGAATESRQVYLANGLLHAGKKQLDVLEVGLGSGLNALLTWQECRRSGLQVRYTALEPFPVAMDALKRLGHPTALGMPGLSPDFYAMMATPAGCSWSHPDGFRFRWERQGVESLDMADSFDVVYFDAFGPKVQPGIWTPEVFRRVARSMRRGAVLATYSVKGAVRRAMAEAGLHAERLPGPPGKLQVLRAVKR